MESDVIVFRLFNNTEYLLSNYISCVTIQVVFIVCHIEETMAKIT